MEVKLIQDKTGFFDLKEEWELLQEKANQITFYNTFHFLFNWWDIYSVEKSCELFLICISEKGKLIGIAPLMIERRRFLLVSYKVLKFIGRADFLNVIIDKDTKAQSVLKKMFETINASNLWDKLELTHISQNSDLAHFCFKSELYNRSFENLGENPTLDIGQSQEFSSYKKGFFKKNINYYHNKLKKDFDATLEIVPGNRAGLLNQIATVHKNRNKSSGDRRSLFEDPTTFNFVKRIYDDGSTMTFLLKSKDNEIISYATCYVYNRVVHNWNTSFNLNYRDYSAGDLIYYELIKYCFEHRDEIKSIDFGAGRYPWKFRLTNSFFYTYKLNQNNKKSKKYHFLEFYDKAFKIGKIVLNKK